jgi:hypothetical protein
MSLATAFGFTVGLERFYLKPEMLCPVFRPTTAKGRRGRIEQSSPFPRSLDVIHASPSGGIVSRISRSPFDQFVFFAPHSLDEELLTRRLARVMFFRCIGNSYGSRKWQCGKSQRLFPPRIRPTVIYPTLRQHCGNRRFDDVRLSRTSNGLVPFR